MIDATGPIDEGYVKYVSEWTVGPAPDSGIVAELNHWRGRLYAQGLIGHYAQLGIGFGNISARVGQSSRFVISGTQTGHIEQTTAEDYALVTDVDIGANRLRCSGPVQASSEALTHAALYALSADINAVVHAHSAALWQRHVHALPTSDEAVAYGTPAMALEFERLWRSSAFADVGIAIMAGHDEGIVSIGASLEEAARRMLELQRVP